MQFLSRLGRSNNPIKNPLFHWARGDMAHGHLFVFAESSPSAWKMPPALFLLAPSHLSKRSQHLPAFDYALRNLLPSKGVTI